MSVIFTLMISVTVPIMYELGKVTGVKNECSHRLSDAPQGLANARKWESYRATTKETEHGIQISRASDTRRGGCTDQSGKGIGPLWSAGFDADHDHVPTRLTGIRSHSTQVGSRGIEAGAAARH